LTPETDNLSKLFHVGIAKEPIHIILIEKNRQRLRILELGESLRVIEDFVAATGENPGNKQDSGDLKTPEGIYFITNVFIDDKITIFGDKAFHLDYPNFFDRQAGRNGDGIYIHGTNKELQPYSTNGCITLNRVELDELGRYITQAVTPVIIVPDLNFLNRNTDLLTKNNFRLAKSLLHDNEINAENVEFNSLYLISFGSQTVAVGDFNYSPSKNSTMSGTSRSYLQYDPVQGWIAAKRFWWTGPLRIYPEKPVKVQAYPKIIDEIYYAGHISGNAPSLAAELKSEGEPSAEKNTTGKIPN
jgi:hypothetical protein